MNVNLIKATMKTEKGGKHRLAMQASLFCSFMALLSLLLGLGMPGVGWVVTMFALLMNSALVPWTGKRYAVVTLVISSIHLFTSGPLSLMGTSGLLLLPITELIIFVVFPMVIPLIAILVPTTFLGKKRIKNE